MAERYAVATGNWSDTATWDGGTLPGVGDDVYSNTYTVTIDQDVTVLSIRNTSGATAVVGGGFECSTSRTINADLHGVSAGPTVPTLKITGTPTVVVNGDCLHGINANLTGVLNLASGSSPTVTLNGNVTNNTAGTYNVVVRGGSLTIVGDLTLGVGSPNTKLVYQSGASTVLTIVGAVNGPTVDLSGGATITSFGGSTNITGNVAAGAATAIWKTDGAMTIVGDITANSDRPAIYFHKTLTGTAYPNYPQGNLEFVHRGNLVSSATGCNAVVSGTLLIHDSDELMHTFRDSSGSLVERSLYTGGTDIGNPSSTDVRSGTAFGPSSEYTGSLEVPDAQYVNAGVLVDSGVGTLAALDASGVRAAIGLSSANLDTQLSSINSAVANGVIVTGVSSGVVTDIWSTYALPESYAASGAEPTPAQMMYLTQQAFTDFSISGTTITVNQIDGTGIAATYTMDDPQTPTSRTRST